MGSNPILSSGDNLPVRIKVVHMSLTHAEKERYLHGQQIKFLVAKLGHMPHLD